MGPVVSLIVVVMLSLLITRIATIMLTATGLGFESARFQARSAFSGVGFTTSEAESVVSHPVRRRIVMGLMLIGNAGIVTVMAALILSLSGAESRMGFGPTLGVLAGGLALVWVFSRSVWIDRKLSALISRALLRFTDIDARDYASLLHLCGGEYGVAELAIGDDHWMADKSLLELGLKEEGMLILGIQRRTGEYLGAPRGAERIERGDTVLVYGRAEAISELDCRCEEDGDQLHAAAVAAHKSPPAV